MGKAVAARCRAGFECSGPMLLDLGE